MRNLIVLTIALLLIIPMTALAGSPPAHGIYQAGWGMNPNNWNAVDGSFYAFGLYDPGSSGGAGWIVDWSDPDNVGYITYDPITLELWIEMHSIQTYHYTSYQWHRLGMAAEHICFIIEGTIQSNNGQYISLTRGSQDLDHLYFIENIFGGADPNARDIPISWQARWGTGLDYGNNVQWGWEPVTPDPEDLTILIPDPCDHWFQFEGCFDLLYHEADGYYSLEMAGCPAPTM